MDASSIYNKFHDTVDAYKHDNWLKIKTEKMGSNYRGYFSLSHMVTRIEAESANIEDPYGLLFGQLLKRLYASSLEQLYHKLNPVALRYFHLASPSQIPNTVNTLITGEFQMKNISAMLATQSDVGRIKTIPIVLERGGSNDNVIYALDINDLALSINLGLKVDTDETHHRLTLGWSLYIGNPNVTQLAIYQNLDNIWKA